MIFGDVTHEKNLQSLLENKRRDFLKDFTLYHISYTHRSSKSKITNKTVDIDRNVEIHTGSVVVVVIMDCRPLFTYLSPR